MKSQPHLNRRRFLRQGVLGVGAGLALPNVFLNKTFAASGESPSEFVRIGVIGTGGQGVANMRAIMKNVVAGRARNGLGHRDAGFMFITGRVFLFVLENHLEARAVIIASKQLALLPDDEATAARQFAALRNNLSGQIRGRTQR